MNQPPDKAAQSPSQSTSVEKYYRFHAKIYDLTRWSFLFGRSTILEKLAKQKTPTNILEVGCGTGKNLLKLARLFPQAKLAGLDISQEMLLRSQNKLKGYADRVELLHQAYDQPLRGQSPFDLILFSYSLSMINPGWEKAIENAQTDLAEGGLIAVVDFENSAWPLFKHWMGINHVRMEGHLSPQLKSHFVSKDFIIQSAYGGLWRYLLFIGEKQSR